jgi:hypothetical protein
MEKNSNQNSNQNAKQQAVVVYQFRPDMNYPIFIQFNDLELEQEMQFIIHELGFVISKREVLDQSAKERKFRILKISSASSKVLKKITSYSQNTFGLGQELVENFGYYEVYVMMRYAMMVMSQASSQWEMALDKEQIISHSHEMETQNALRLTLNRYLSSALAFMEVMVFWGKINQKSVTIMTQSEAQNQCVYVDIVKNKIFSNSQGSLPVMQAKILIAHQNSGLLKEELFGVLASRALYFSSGQIPKAFMIQQISQIVREQQKIFVESNHIAAS